MKLQYEGQELETITEGYWPERVTLVGTDGGSRFSVINDSICLYGGCALRACKVVSAHWEHWAILPPKPATRRLTNREALSLCRKGWDVLYRGDVAAFFIYPISEENNEACEYCEKLRAPGSDEWLEPTSDLLEVGE